MNGFFSCYNLSVLSVRSVFVLSSRACREISFFIYPFLAHSAKTFLLRFFGAKKVAKKHSPIQGLPPGEGCKDANGSRGRPTTPVPFWYRGTRDILSYIPAVAVPWKGTHRSAERSEHMLLLMRQPKKTTSRVPRYQKGTKGVGRPRLSFASPYVGGLGGSTPLLVRFLG